MIPLYTQEEFDSAKTETLLPLQCVTCSTTFLKSKTKIKMSLNPKYRLTGDYCSHQCRNFISKSQTLTCKNCNVTFNRIPSLIKKSTSHFCCQSCAATYNNKNKKYGTRRSKLEKWLEEQLTILYPNLEIHYNQKSVIKSELDIYIPSLNIAFELNGIFHYEPVYGIDKLNKIKNNDKKKI